MEEHIQGGFVRNRKKWKATYLPKIRELFKFPRGKVWRLDWRTSTAVPRLRTPGRGAQGTQRWEWSSLPDGLAGGCLTKGEGGSAVWNMNRCLKGRKKTRQNKIRKGQFGQKVCKGRKAGDTLVGAGGRTCSLAGLGWGVGAYEWQHSTESRGWGRSSHLQQGEERFYTQTHTRMCIYTHSDYFFPFIDVIGVTLVNEAIQVAGAQFHGTSSVPVLCAHRPSQI